MYICFLLGGYLFTSLISYFEIVLVGIYGINYKSLIFIFSSRLTYKIKWCLQLGAFLAGAILAETNFRTQIEADIRPFRGLLLGLFFVATGTSIDMQVGSYLYLFGSSSLFQIFFHMACHILLAIPTILKEMLINKKSNMGLKW